MAKSLQLRWLDADAPTLDVIALGDLPSEAPPAGGPAGNGIAFNGTRHDVVNAITAVAVAADLLDERWEDLSDEQRRDLATTVRKRADQLRWLLAEG